jgi:hypothetical protein
MEADCLNEKGGGGEWDGELFINIPPSWGFITPLSPWRIATLQPTLVPVQLRSDYMATSDLSYSAQL